MSTMNEPVTNGTKAGVLSTTARKALLLYFGLVATAIEESYTLLDRLVEHSKAAEQEGRQRLQAAMERRQEAVQPVEGEAGGLSDRTRARLTFPSRTAIATLDEQIARLSQEIDELIRQQDR